MKLQTILIVTMALIFGGSAAVGVSTGVKRNTRAGQQEQVTVVVTAADIPATG